MAGLLIFVFMNSLQNITFDFNYSIVENILYGRTTISGVICENASTKVAGVNLQKVIRVAIDVVKLILGLLQLFGHSSIFLPLILLILT